MISTPDELERIPAPQRCRTCASWVEFKTGNVERQLCSQNKPQHESCGWYWPRTPSLVADRGQT